MRSTVLKTFYFLLFCIPATLSVPAGHDGAAFASENRIYGPRTNNHSYDWRDFRDDRRLDQSIARGVAGGVAGQIAGEAINDAIVRGYENNLIDRSRRRSRVNIERGNRPLGLTDRHYNWCYENYTSYEVNSNTYINEEGIRTHCISPDDHDLK